MTSSGPCRQPPHRPPKWLRLLEIPPASQWSTGHRVVHGLLAVLMMAAIFYTAVNGPHARGPWVGVLTVLVFGPMFGSVIVAPRRYERWFRTHRHVDAVFLVPLLFFALALVTPLSLLWCAVIALATTAVLILLGRRQWLRDRWEKRWRSRPMGMP